MLVVGFLALVCLLFAVVAVTARAEDGLATLEEAHVHDDTDDEGFARRRWALTGERADRVR